MRYYSCENSAYVNLVYDKNSKVVKLTDVLNSAVDLKNYITNHEVLPSTVSVSGVSYTMDEFLYLMAKSIYNIQDKDLSDIHLPFMHNSLNYQGIPVNDNLVISLSLYNYGNLARNIGFFIEASDYAPSNLTILSYKLNYDALSYSFAKILSYYLITGELPSKAVFNTNISDACRNYIYGSGSNNVSEYRAGVNEVNTLSDISSYLISGRFCEITSNIQNTANLLTAGCTSTSEKATAIFTFVKETISYSYYSNSKGASTALETKRANSCDKSNLLVALCRAVNIPIRYNWANLEFNSGIGTAHVWTQILLDNTWYVADASSTRNYLGVINNWNINSISGLVQYSILPSSFAYIGANSVSDEVIIEENQELKPSFDEDIIFAENSKGEMDIFKNISFEKNPIIVNESFENILNSSVDSEILNFDSWNQVIDETGTVIVKASDFENLSENNANSNINNIQNAPIISDIVSSDINSDGISYSSSKKNTVISSEEYDKEYGNDFFLIHLKDIDGVPLVNKEILVTLSNALSTKSYYLNTSVLGVASLAIGLVPGNWNVNYRFNGDSDYNPSEANGVIRITKSGTSLTLVNSTIGVGDELLVLLKDLANVSLANQTVNLLVGGNSYSLITDIFGYVKLATNLSYGVYPITYSFQGNDCYLSSQNTGNLVIKYKTKILANDLVTHSGEDYFELVLVDYKGDILSGKLVETKILDSKFNLVKTYSSATDYEGVLRTYVRLGPGLYTVFYKFSETNDYLGSYGMKELIIVPDDSLIKTSLDIADVNIHKKGDSFTGQLLDSSGNPVANANIVVTLFAGSEYKNYYLITDNMGYYSLEINLAVPGEYIVFSKFLGNSKYDSIMGSNLLNVSYSPNLEYLVNITTKDNFIDGGSSKNITLPYGREIGIYKNNNVYKFTYDYSSSGATQISDNILYFISFSDNSGYSILGSVDDIKTAGVSLFSDGNNILIKYYGYISNNISQFSAIFDGKRAFGKYISNLTLLYDDAVLASLYFSSEIYTSNTRQSAYNQLHVWYDSYTFYEGVSTNCKITDNYGYTICADNILDLYYGDISNFDVLASHRWSSSLGYEAIESYLIYNSSKITESMMGDYVNKANALSGSRKVAYETFLVALSHRWLCIKLADELAEKYDVTWSDYGMGLYGSFVGINGRSLDAPDTVFASGGNWDNSVFFENRYYFYGSVLEQYAMDLTGSNGTCAVTEVLKGLLNGEDMYYYNNTEGNIVLSLKDNSSYLEFYEGGGIGGIISTNTSAKYHGGIGLLDFFFDQASVISSNLKSLALVPMGFITNIIAQKLVDSLYSTPSGRIIGNYLSNFVCSTLGCELFYLGIGLAITAPVSFPIALVGVGVAIGGACLVGYANGVFKNITNPKGYVFSVMDLASAGIGGKVVKYVSKFGLEGGAHSVFEGLGTFWTTSITDSAKEIINGITG